MNHDRQLLSELESSLLGIVSAITQTPSDFVRRERMVASIATAKVTSVATSAGLFGLVASLGTAGTGTAIGTLSGAASTSATLAWIGGLVGGGMAAGAIILPAVGIAAGAVATMTLRKKLFPKQRAAADLKRFEHEILLATDTLLRPLSNILRDERTRPNATELRIFAHDGLRPLLARFETHLGRPLGQNGVPEPEDRFALTLSPKYYRALVQAVRILRRQEVELSRPKREPASIRLKMLFARLSCLIFGKRTASAPETQLSSVVLAVTFQRLLSDMLTDLSLEHELVLDALRRSTGTLRDASVKELADYVQSLSPEQLRGVVSNTKGIYHEMLFVQRFNSDHDDVTAQMMEATNHPGADVQFLMDGNVVSEVQLKAVSSPTLVHEHLRRYPDVELLATEETAALMDGIDSSGFSNAVLTRDVADRMFDLKGEGLLDEVTDGLLASALVRSGVIVYAMLTERRLRGFDPGTYIKDAGVAVGTASILDGVIALSGN